jgi:AcrR family transcriptional regulator
VEKGEKSRTAILSSAARLASRVGLEGITIGQLATELGRSKSGLFAHFASKEQLQLDTLDFALRRFVDEVIKPSLAQPRGEPRIRSLFERWLAWAQGPENEGGCIFTAAATELDDRPGAVRNHLVCSERDWLDTLARAAEIAVKEGHLRPGLDAEQFAFELHAIMLGYHHSARLLRDADAGQRAQKAFQSLMSAARQGRTAR